MVLSLTSVRRSNPSMWEVPPPVITDYAYIGRTAPFGNPDATNFQDWCDTYVVSGYLRC
jgi:hypothetical protein